MYKFHSLLFTILVSLPQDLLFDKLSNQKGGSDPVTRWYVIERELITSTRVTFYHKNFQKKNKQTKKKQSGTIVFGKPKF